MHRYGHLLASQHAPVPAHCTVEQWHTKLLTEMSWAPSAAAAQGLMVDNLDIWLLAELSTSAYAA